MDYCIVWRLSMRGSDGKSGSFFSDVDLDERIREHDGRV